MTGDSGKTYDLSGLKGKTFTTTADGGTVLLHNVWSEPTACLMTPTMLSPAWPCKLSAPRSVMFWACTVVLHVAGDRAGISVNSHVNLENSSPAGCNGDDAPCIRWCPTLRRSLCQTGGLPQARRDM